MMGMRVLWQLWMVWYLKAGYNEGMADVVTNYMAFTLDQRQHWAALG